jgi:S-DNA-T family DNA segregation ATPase FtsK/SpoIIIE
MPTRVHGAFVSDEKCIAWSRPEEAGRAELHRGNPARAAHADSGISGEEEEAARAAPAMPSRTRCTTRPCDRHRERKASISYVQRRLKIGYNRAASTYLDG